MQWAARRRFHPPRALLGDARVAPARTVLPNPYLTTARALVNPAPAGKEMTMKRVSIGRRKTRHERPWREVLPLDPRDPDVVRAKALARAGQARQEVIRK